MPARPRMTAPVEFCDLLDDPPGGINIGLRTLERCGRDPDRSGNELDTCERTEELIPPAWSTLVLGLCGFVRDLQPPCNCVGNRPIEKGQAEPRGNGLCHLLAASPIRC